MYLKCKECGETISISKFYPKGGFISGEGSGWWASKDNLQEQLNDFYEKHAHEFDYSSFGGEQYLLEYEIHHPPCPVPQGIIRRRE